MKNSRRIAQLVLLGLAVWIASDFLIPRQRSIRQFAVGAIAERDAQMWQSYYRREPVRLFGQLAGALRDQFGAPFWRSWGLAFWAAKAAFDFKNGHNHTDYERVIPTLEHYFAGIRALSVEPFDARQAARAELDWWIVHREAKQYPPGALAQALARAAAVLYHQPPADFLPYGQHRAEAMRLRDEAGTTQADWPRIERELNLSWAALHEAIGHWLRRK